MTDLSVLHAGRLLDPATGETISEATVVMEDGVITAVGPRASVAAPRDAAVIDASGLTVMPGLIDCHVHLCMRGDGLDLAERLATPPSLAVLEAVVSCRKTLDAGFTTVRDAGFTPDGVRLAVDRGYFPGPRMQLAITILSQTGGHVDNHFPCGATVGWNPSPDIPEPVVDGVEPMRQRVRETIRAGADWIKICTSGGVLSPSDSPHHANFTLGEIEAAVEEAAAQGRQVMSHAIASAGVKNALRAGVATIEHGIRLDDEAIAMMLEGNRALVPTLLAPVWVIRHAERGRMPAWAASKARAVVEAHKASVRRAIEARVRIAFGTDTGVGPQGTMGEEFLRLHELGMTPLDCIRSATTVAADVLGMQGKVGAIVPGAYGDMVGVDGDPLDRLELLATPDRLPLVVKGGSVVKSPLH
jgi:imidazolonepropionase-like amidohydrolase